MSTNLVQSLRDSAQLSSLPNWVRQEFEQAADRIEELEDIIRLRDYAVDKLDKLNDT